jgi:alkanesulfonate monooxygenase SsuD/methylene tetrahydromethanopterin reductase-like flavin-dependent oxidoreductase (luciferase family)
MERTGAYLIPGADLHLVVDLAQRAEAWGYESLWVTHGYGRDSFLVLSAYAQATRFIGLGNGVVPIYPRHPVAMAQEALTLAELSAGRFRLGVGVSHRPTMEGSLGLDMGKPLEVMREYVAILRAALTGRVEHTGARYRVNWTSGLPRLPGQPPILLAGLSAKMLELSGEIADGAVLWLCAPTYIRDVAIPAIARGRQKVGKSLEGFEVVAAVPVALTDEVGATSALFKEELTRYLALPFYRAMLTASGFGEELAAFDSDKARSASPGRAVPARLVTSLAGIGDRKAIRDCVAAYREAGVTLPAIRPISFPEAPHYRPTLETMAPH